MTLDARINAYRADLADIRLQGQVDAKRYVTPTPGTVIIPMCNLRTAPSNTSPVGTQLLLGEALQIFETQDDWLWVQSSADGYVGYAQASEIDVNKSAPLTHAVTTMLAHVYAQADIKSEPLELLPMGAKFNAVGVQSDTWLTLARGGYIKAAATEPLGTKDFVEIAARFTGAPYLWGGKTALGIDCSGLVQVALMATGRACPRDSDMQEAELGELLPSGAVLRRGDLIFFKGHVGIMWDAANLIHASATWMRVVIEPLVGVEKIAAVTSQRRIS